MSEQQRAPECVTSTSHALTCKSKFCERACASAANRRCHFPSLSSTRASQFTACLLRFSVLCTAKSRAWPGCSSSGARTMRLREKVTQLRFEGSSDDDEEEEAADDAWQPNSRDGSDADEAPVTERLVVAPAEPAPRQLTHADLAAALLRLAAKTHAPLCVAPEELTQVRPEPRARCAAPTPLTCAAGLGARRWLERSCAGARGCRRGGCAGHAAAAGPGRRSHGCRAPAAALRVAQPRHAGPRH